MLLKFENVDFDYVKQTIDGLIMYTMCLRGVIEKENISNNQNIEISEKNVLLSLQAMVKGDDKVYDKFLDKLYEKAIKDNTSNEFKECFYYLNMISLFVTMKNLEDFRIIVSSTFNTMDEEGKIKSNYLYRDKNTVQENKTKIMYYNNLSFIYDPELKILNKTKEIACECINEALSRYYNVNTAISSFTDRFVKNKIKGGK